VNGPTFIYVDYGSSPWIGRELRYSLATLLAEYERPKVVVYTDKPDVYASLHASVSARALGGDLLRWTRAGAYNHRIKPCVLIDALATQGGLGVLLDTDSYIAEGFAAALVQATRLGPAMDHFERLDPYPEIAGWSMNLPSRAYSYDGLESLTFNSGLTAALAGRDETALEDALALIDALWDAGRRMATLEQVAVSEAFRLHGRPIGEMRPTFQHYCRPSLKRYMHWRLDDWARNATGLRPTRPCIAHPRWRERAFNHVNKWGRWYT